MQWIFTVSAGVVLSDTSNRKNSTNRRRGDARFLDVKEGDRIARDLMESYILDSWRLVIRPRERIGECESVFSMCVLMMAMLPT